MSSNPPVPNNSIELEHVPHDSNIPRKKRRKLDVDNVSQGSPIEWRTAAKQQIYSTKLVQALRNTRRGGGGVRETADRVLAVTAKGKTRWSRAILTNQLSMRLHLINRKHKRARKPGVSELRKPALKKKKKKVEVAALQQKVGVLGSLVPGCRKISFPNLLEETTDYIAALEMQVRAMTFLTQLLNGAAEEPPVPTRRDTVGPRQP